MLPFRIDSFSKGGKIMLKELSPMKAYQFLFCRLFHLIQTYPEFKAAFQNLTSALSMPMNSHWLMSGHMVQLIKRCIAEEKFWPSSELKQLIDLKCVPPGYVFSIF